MVKNGTTSTKRTRWRCKPCNLTHTRTRTDRTKDAEFRTFHTWISGKHSLTEIASQQGSSRRTFTRRFAWCWLITPPRLPCTGTIWDQVCIDGTYLGDDCLLTATAGTIVIASHWCRRETTADYIKLLRQFPAPRVIVTDGHRGALAAIRTTHPASRVQRCLVHIQRGVRQKISTQPRTKAGKALRGLSLQLTSITTPQQAVDWLQLFNDCLVTFHDWLNERTYRKDVTEADIPAWAKKNKSWWYTHHNTRQALSAMQTPLRNGHLFTFLDPDLQAACQQPVAATTNRLEGGLNAPLKRLVEQHRGITGERLRRLVDWYLLARSEAPVDPVVVARQQAYGHAAHDHANALLNDERKHQPGTDIETGAPAMYDTSIDLEYSHSLGIQRGWAGHS